MYIDYIKSTFKNIKYIQNIIYFFLDIFKLSIDNIKIN